MRLNDGRAVPAFMSQVAAQRGRHVFGDGSQTRSFTYITDLVDGIIKLMLSSENDPVNIGNPVEMTIKQIAETIISMTGSTSQIVYRRCRPTTRSSAARHHPRAHAARLGAEGAARRGLSRRSSISAPRSARNVVARKV
jgi:nucleoside-diphosphate-sugar epimerase